MSDNNNNSNNSSSSSNSSNSSDNDVLVEAKLNENDIDSITTTTLDPVPITAISTTDTINETLSLINLNQISDNNNNNNNSSSGINNNHNYNNDNSSSISSSNNNNNDNSEHIENEIINLQHKQEEIKEEINELREELNEEIKQEEIIKKEIENDLDKDIKQQNELCQQSPEQFVQQHSEQLQQLSTPPEQQLQNNENNTPPPPPPPQQQQQQDQSQQNQKQILEQPILPIIDTPTIFQNLYEYFIVVGLPADSDPKIGVSHKPELLFSYPSDKEVPPKVKEFCFPSGITPQIIRRTPSRSNLNEMLFGQSYIHSPNHYFTFVLSSENPLYGICITKPELLQSIPNFFPQQPKLLEKAPSYISAPRCYCFLSKIPIFNIHFDALLYILAQDRLITTTRELSSTEDEMIQEQKLKEKKDKELFNEREHNFIQQQQQQQQQIDSPLNTVDNVSVTGSDVDSEAEEDIKHLVDKQNLLDILKYYYQPFEIKSGQKIKLLFPNDSHPREYNIPKCKTVQELNALSISEWSIGGTFLSLSVDNILRILSAVLLEQRVVFVCDNLATLSSCCFSMISLIHPLVWQGLFVPILPQNLLDYLDAPVPFVFGVSSLIKKNFDGLIVYVKNDKIIYKTQKQPPLIPEFHKLLNNLKDDRTVLVNQKNYNPVKNTKHQLEAVHKIFYIIQQYTQWLFKKIESQFITVNINDSLEIEEFKQRFLSTVSDHNKDFIKMLLDTQHFNHFLNTNISLQQYQKQQKEKENISDQEEINKTQNN